MPSRSLTPLPIRPHIPLGQLTPLQTLFRVAVAILKLNEGDILDTTSVSDLFALMSGMTSRLWTADKLIQVQHSYKPIIRGGDVEAKFQKHLANLRAE